MQIKLKVATKLKSFVNLNEEMNSPSSTASAKFIFQEPKNKLCDRVTANLNSIGHIATSLGKGTSGKAQEVLHTKTFHIFFNYIFVICLRIAIFRFSCK